MIGKSSTAHHTLYIGVLSFYDCHSRGRIILIGQLSKQSRVCCPVYLVVKCFSSRRCTWILHHFYSHIGINKGVYRWTLDCHASGSWSRISRVSVWTTRCLRQ